MNMKSKSKILLVLLMTAILCGCGGKTDEESVEASASEETVDYGEQYRQEPVINLLAGDWKKEDITNPDSFMSVSEYRQETFEDHEQTRGYPGGCCVDQNRIYYLRTYYFQTEGEQTVDIRPYMDILDCDTMTIQTIACPAQNFDFFSVSQGRIMTYADGRDEDGYVTGFQARELYEDGTTSEPVDLFPVVEMGIPLPNAAWFVMELDALWEARSGHHYLIPADGSGLYVADEEGNLVTEFHGFGEGKTTISAMCQTYDGIWLFRSWDSVSKQTSVFYFDGDTPVVLYEGNVPAYQEIFADSHGNFLYLDNNNALITWNILTGEQTRRYIGSKEIFQYLLGLARNENGDVVLFSDDNTLRIITTSGPAVTATIRLQPYIFLDYGMQTAIANYERTHPGVTIEIGEEYRYDEKDNKINQIYADIARGEGPDIIQLDREQLMALQDKDCLMNLDGVLSEQLESVLFQGLLDSGRIDGEQYMLPTSAATYTLMVNNEVWDKPSWTVQEFIDVIEAREAAGTPFKTLCSSSFFTIDPLYLFIRDIGHSDFLDAEKKTCSFDSDEFIHILEICKRYQISITDNFVESTESWGRTVLQSGEVLVYADRMSFSGFSSTMAALGPDYHFVGYPTNADNGNFIYCYSGMAVNKNTEHFEIIKDFLNSLYEFNDTLVSDVILRRDYYDGRIITPKNAEWVTQPQVRLDGHTYTIISGKPDGESYIEEYLEIMDSLTPYETQYDFIRGIITEEADAYFTGDKTAEIVAQNIQSRVQLYLDEQ